MQGWIADGEKYALVGLDLHVDDNVEMGPSTAGVRVISGLQFSVPEHWKEWLGSIRCNEIEGCNLFLVSTRKSAAPGVLDAENQELQRRVWNAYIGLLLATPLFVQQKPIQLTGSCSGNEIDVRQQRDFATPVHTPVTRSSKLPRSVIQDGLSLGGAIDALRDPDRTGRYWRLVRTLTIFVRACEARDILDRIHQFCRCLEGLILPDQGLSKKQFRSRTELMIGPEHHQLTGDLYDVRSAVEHLHEDRYLHPYKRETAINILRWEAISFWMARTSLARILGSSVLRSHFGNDAAVSQFWSLDKKERQTLWGTTLNPTEPLSGFQPEFLSDAELAGE